MASVLAGAAALTLAWILRGPLLLDSVRDEIVAQIASELDAEVACSDIEGDPFGEVTLSLDVRRSGLQIEGARLTLDLDPNAIALGSSRDAVRRLHLFAHRVELNPNLLESSSTSDTEERRDSETQDSTDGSLPHDIKLHVREFVYAGRPGFDARDLEVHVDRVEIAKTIVDSTITGRIEVKRARFGTLRVGRLRTVANWSNHELALTELKLDDIRGPDSRGEACRAQGKGRIDLPRGRARTVARVHWDLSGRLTPQAFSSIGDLVAPVAPAPFTSSGSIKLPIQYGSEKEYLAGKVRLDVRGISVAGFRRPLELRAEAEIDGLGLLIFDETRLRSAAHDFVEVRGRYPLHRYGRPDLRVTVDVPDFGPWSSFVRLPGLELPKRGSLRSMLRVRGNKRDPQIRLKADVDVGTKGAMLFEGLARHVEDARIRESLRALEGPMRVETEVRGTGTRPEIRRLEIESPGLALVGSGESPLGLKTGFEWHDDLVALQANRSVRWLDLLGTWRRAGRAVAMRLRCVADGFRVLETRVANPSLIGSSSLR